jgi:uncharacterized protein YecE (DUF72 family)
VRAFVGTSGWQYRHWRGSFYPTELAASAWLGYYADRFATVEVNASFYRLPGRETVERWAGAVPAGFVLTFKASRYVTHVRRLRECAEPLERMWSVVAGAGAKLGPVLFQLPPTLRVDEPLLREFLLLLPPRMRAAFEFRHPSWSTDGVHEALDAAGAALVHADRPGVHVRIPTVGGWAYLRFHQGRRTAAGYRRPKLRAYADAAADARPAELFAYFNNDMDTAAPRDAAVLAALLADRRIEVAAA